MRQTCSAGGLIVRGNEVLLVKVMYGANKDFWMFPGGLADEGETFEEAAIREVREETGVSARPKRLIGVRTGMKQHQNEIEMGIHFIFEMEIVEGELNADGSEISEVRYRQIDEVLADSQVISLTKEILRSYRNALPNAGLSKLENTIHTNNKYTQYAVYSLT